MTILVVYNLFELEGRGWMIAEMKLRKRLRRKRAESSLVYKYELV